MNRAVGVAKMQLINKWTFLGIPAVIIAASFLLTLAIWAMIPPTGVKVYSGAGQAVMWYFLGLGVQSLTLSFPFSQGLSVSRRNFFLGTLGLFTLIAASIAALYVVLGFVELGTNGWGMNGSMFAIAWVADASWFIQWFFYFVMMMTLFLIGFWFATIYKRWQATGMLITSITLGVGFVAALGLTTWQGWWPAVGAWILTLTPGSLGLVALGLAALLGVGAYLTLRKATP